MRILDAIRKGADVPLYGGGSTMRSSRMQRMALASSHYDYATEAGSLYDNGVVLPAINWKANAISECEIIVQEFDKAKGKWTRSTEGGPVKQLLQALELPNDYYDGTTLWHGVQLSWDVRGQAFLIKRRDNLGRLMGFYWIPHTQMRPMASRDNQAGTKLVTHYEYTPFGGSPRDVEISEVVHLRYGMDPKDPASGFSPLAAELRDICTDNEVSNWLASILRNGATPGAILVPKVDAKEPTPDQKKKFKELWNSFVGDKRGEAFISPLPVDVITPGFNPQQMELGKLREIPTARILAALGLDPLVLGLPSESKTFSNYEQATDAAGKRTIVPSIQKWAKQTGRQVLPEFGLDPAMYRLYWDTAGVSWLQDETDDLHTRVRDDFAAGVIDRATAKEMLGLEASPDDVGVYATDLKGIGMEPAPPKDQKKALIEAIAKRTQERRRDLERLSA